MAPKSRRRNQVSTSAAYAADIDSDAPFSLPTVHATNARRSLAEINLSVLQRTFSSVTSITHIVPMAVLYTFATSTQTWEKSGVEGSLFIVELAPKILEPGSGEIEVTDRCGLIILNRLSMHNFDMELLREEDVDVQGEFIIIQGDGSEVAGREAGLEPVIYGMWTYMDDLSHRDALVELITVCARRAESSRTEAERLSERLEDERATALRSSTMMSSEQQASGPAAGRSLIDLLIPKPNDSGGASTAQWPAQDSAGFESSRYHVNGSAYGLDGQHDGREIQQPNVLDGLFQRMRADQRSAM